ncbi:MAG: tetratricopeptide repeat protein [Acidobacteria bacterium]|nr:tetratricopeptide repeat protein [Acidobacteriota bacterium]
MEALKASDGFTRADIRRILNIHERSLKAWERHRLIDLRGRLGFGDLAALRTLKRLSDSRIPALRIKNSLAALRKRTGVRRPLVDLTLRPQGRKIAVQTSGALMEAETGQFLLPFDPHAPGRVKTLELRATPPPVRLDEAETWFQRGLEIEERGGEAETAREAYERTVELNPMAAGAWVNLGTLLYRARQLEEAEKRYVKALEIAPDYALAHFNLGNVYEEQGRLTEALDAYQTALRIEPGYADAHYNLALVYERTGELMRAAKHWRAYLKLDPASPWAGIARQQLGSLLQVTPGGQARRRPLRR